MLNGSFPLLALPSLLQLEDAGSDSGTDFSEGSGSSSSSRGGGGGRAAAKPPSAGMSKDTDTTNAADKLWAVWDVMAEPWLWRPMVRTCSWMSYDLACIPFEHTIDTFISFFFFCFFFFIGQYHFYFQCTCMYQNIF